MRILVTGGSGFLGKPLVKSLLSEGYAVRVLSRDVEAARASLPRAAEVRPWAAPGPLPADCLDGVDAVAHLSGENVGQWPWSGERKRRIRESRVLATRSLVQAMAGSGSPPKTLVSASAIGYYGNAGDTLRSEADPPGQGYLASVVKDWERETFRAREAGVRTVALRLGVVLGQGGGALGKMLPAFRLGLGAVIGPGTQYMGWIHRDDAVRLLVFALRERAAEGPLNACAPSSTTNREFSRALAEALGRPLLFRIPAFAVKLALGEMGRETLLASQRISSAKAESLGFAFRYPSLPAALADIVRQGRAGSGGAEGR